MNIDLTPIIQAVIGLLAAIVSYKLIPLIKAKTTAEQQGMMKATVRTLVFAAEQIYGAGRGGEKLQYVKQQLQKQGFDVDVNQIEAAVCELALFTPEIEVEENVAIESLNHPE